MGKYILITGGELFNKGAQAMTFITVDEMAKRYPDKEVVLVSNRDFMRSKEDKGQYKFSIAKFPAYRYILMLQFKLGNFLLKATRGEAGAFVRMLNEAEMVLDISGYALGANWGANKSISYLLKIGMAKTAKVPVYLMPQSFGPFDFTGKRATQVNYLLRKLLPYPRKIMAREQEGYELLTNKFGLNNVVKTCDLVLQNKGIDCESIYFSQPSEMQYAIHKGSVAIIPNQKLMVYGNTDRIYELYNRLIDDLLQAEKNVYLIYHAKEDLDICRVIKGNYKDEERVRIIEKELSCLEFDKLVNSFDYVIASRFHSIVHAYKNAVPALVLGWAGKYRELVELFGQGQFMFDVREQIQQTEVCDALRLLNAEYADHSDSIKRVLEQVQKESVFDLLDC